MQKGGKILYTVIAWSQNSGEENEISAFNSGMREVESTKKGNERIMNVFKENVLIHTINIYKL